MLHVDIPSRADIEWLAGVREPACLTLYLPTTPITPKIEHDKLVFKNLARDGLQELRDRDADRRAVAAIEEELDDLLDDDAFWAHQANSLAVYATAEHILTFRLPNALEPTVQTADRFLLIPLLRSVTVAREAFVIALAQGSVRLVEISADLPPSTVDVADLPHDMASAVGEVLAKDRSMSGRPQRSESRKVRMSQYARLVDRALRQVLAGRDTPLILAAAAPLDAIFRNVSTYPHLAEATIAGNPEERSDLELARDAREILDRLHRDDLDALTALFSRRRAQGRATTDVLAAARAATLGAVATLFIDIDQALPGIVDEEDGTVRIQDEGGPGTYSVADEIARRALASGARVLAVRRPDVPGGEGVAAILRYAL